jgi:hypothetical protein
MRLAGGLGLIAVGIVVGATVTAAVLRRGNAPVPPAAPPEVIPLMPPTLPEPEKPSTGDGTLSKLREFIERDEALRQLEALDRTLREKPKEHDCDLRPDRCGLDKFLSDADAEKVHDVLEDEDRRLQAVLESFMAGQATPGTDPLPSNSWDSLRVVIGTERIAAGISALADLPREKALLVRKGTMSIGEALGMEHPLAILAERLHQVRNETYARVDKVLSADDAAEFRKWLPQGLFSGRRCALDLGRAPVPLRR